MLVGATVVCLGVLPAKDRKQLVPSARMLFLIVMPGVYL